MRCKKSILLLSCLCVLMVFCSSAGVFAMGNEEYCEYDTVELLDASVFLSEEGLTYTCPHPVWNNDLKEYEYLTYSVPSEVYSVGVDVSKWQKDIDWEKVRACGIDYAIIRLGYRSNEPDGKIGLDSYYQKNIEGAKAAGLKVGVYFFSQATTIAEAQEEAAFVMRYLKGYTLDLPIVMDYEFSNNGRLNQAYDTTDANKKLNPQKAADICLAFCDMVESYGYASMVYANQSMLTTYVDGARLSRETEVWLARYNTSNAYPNAYQYWQFTSKGYVDGIDGNVDLNFRFVDIAYPSGGGFFPFVDVASDQWYYAPVKYAYDHDLFYGTEWNKFDPQGGMTRAMLVSVLYRMEGSPAMSGTSKFKDLTADWYKDAVLWGEKTGVVSGISPTLFGPDQPLTREQMVTFMQRYASYKKYDVSADGYLGKFSDGWKTSLWAMDAVKWAVGEGYVSGFEDGTLRPNASTTRAEVATVLKSFCENNAIY